MKIRLFTCELYNVIQGSSCDQDTNQVSISICSKHFKVDFLVSTVVSCAEENQQILPACCWDAKILRESSGDSTGPIQHLSKNLPSNSLLLHHYDFKVQGLDFLQITDAVIVLTFSASTTHFAFAPLQTFLMQYSFNGILSIHQFKVSVCTYLTLYNHQLLLRAIEEIFNTRCKPHVSLVVTIH